MSGTYPLVFEPELKEKVWGGRGLGRILGKELPPEGSIGESWEVYGESVVANGPHAGRTVDSLREELGERLVGARLTPLADLPFPLLFKYIDATEMLSVQVHPDDAYAREHTGYPYGKTEAWYIVAAEPGARIVHGWKRPTSREEVEAAVKENRLEELLEYVPVSAGDVIHAPAGTVHALGGGIVLGELQQNSDTTYRLYDWGRMGLDGKPRELHLRESLETLNYDLTERHKTPALEAPHDGALRRFLVACRYFVIESLEGEGPLDMTTGGERFELLSALDGPVRLAWEDGELELERGRTALLPAALGSWRLHPVGRYKALRMYPPDLRADVVAPLQEAGYSREEIEALGGDPRYNDLLHIRSEPAPQPATDTGSR
jgi:mannose-6-phosphate isomerase